MTDEIPPPVRGILGMERVGLTVPDLEQAIGFFASVLGAETLYEHGPFSAEDNWMAVNLGVDARAVVPRIVVMRVGSGGPALELFEYERSPGSAADDLAARRPPMQSEVGGVHLSFHVEDIDAAVESLHAHGAIVLGQPKRVAEGPGAGLAWVHFLAPWGQQLGLASHPSGIRALGDPGLGAGRPGSGARPPETDLDGVADLDADPI